MKHTVKYICCLLLLSGVVEGQISTHVGIGGLYINGDVDPVIDPLNSFHVAINSKFRNDFNAELKLGFGKTGGLSGTFMESEQNGGGLIEDTYAGLDNKVWYPYYLTSYGYADLSVNYILQTGIERLRFIGGGGVGFSISNSNVNLFFGEDFRYNTKLPSNTSIDEAKVLIKRAYDNTFETKFDEGGGFIPHLTFQVGIQFKLRRGIFLTGDIRYHLTTSDYLDPIKNITSTQESGNNDSVSMFTIGFIGYLLPDEKEDSPVK